MVKAKRIGCLILAVVLALSLAACAGGGGASPASSGSAPASSGAASSGGSAATGEWAPTTSYDEKVSLTMATVQTLEAYNYVDGDPYVKYWSDKFNYDIEVTSLTFDNWAERLRIWINSGDMPDICVFDYKHPDAATFVDQGLIKKMPDDWKSRWPNLAGVHDKTTLGPQMEGIFEGVYFLPRARFDVNIPGDPLPDHLSFFMRKDWAEAVGFPIKSMYKTSEVIEYGKLVKEKDPGELGANLLPISSRPHWAVELFVGRNSTHYKNFYQDTDGSFKWGPASEDTLLGLKLMLESVNTGAMNPEFYTLKDIDDYDQFRVSAVSGGYFGEAATGGLRSVLEQYFRANTGLNPDDCVNVATILGEDGYYHQEDLINYWGCTIFNPKIDDSKFERYMDMLDYGCTEEGYLIQRMGFEGEDYEVVDAANHEFKSLIPEGQSLTGNTGKYPGMSYVIAVTKLADDFAFWNPNIEKKYRDLSWQLYTERCETATAETFSATNWTIYTHDSPSMRKAVFDLDTELTNLVTSSKTADELEANWRKWVEQNSTIVQPVIDELQAK